MAHMAWAALLYPAAACFLSVDGHMLTDAWRLLYNISRSADAAESGRNPDWVTVSTHLNRQYTTDLHILGLQE